VEAKTVDGAYVFYGELKPGLAAELVKAHDRILAESVKQKLNGLRFDNPRQVIEGFMYEAVAKTIMEILFRTEGGFFIPQDDYKSSDEVCTLADEIMDNLDCRDDFIQRLLKV